MNITNLLLVVFITYISGGSYITYGVSAIFSVFDFLKLSTRVKVPSFNPVLLSDPLCSTKLILKTH